MVWNCLLMAVLLLVFVQGLLLFKKNKEPGREVLKIIGSAVFFLIMLALTIAGQALSDFVLSLLSFV